ncbi:MAG: TonB-dependent receptor [Opitutales bacterium]
MKQNLLLSISRKLGLVALAVASAASAFAGNITGRVFDEGSAKYIQGVFVSIPSLELRTTTELDGSYIFRSVPNGTYEISVSYVGYPSQTKSVTASDADVVVNFSMASEIAELEAFEATGEFLAGQARAVNLQRAGKGIKNVINEEVFGQMDDGNIGKALARMPGATVDTDGFSEVPRYVNVRGFDASLNSVQLDGNRLSTSGSGNPASRGGGTAYSNSGRAFRLDDVPADAITNIEIVKSPTPDMPGDALGGTVNMITKNAFQYEDRYINLRIAGDFNERRDEWGSTGAFTYADTYALGDSELPNLGVTVNLSYSDANEGFDNLDTDTQWISDSTDILVVGGTSATNVDIDNFYLDGPANDYLTPQLNAGLEELRSNDVDHPVLGFIEDIESNNYDIDRQRVGANVSFDYKLNESTDLFFKSTYSGETRTSRDYRHHLIGNNDHFDPADPYEQYVSPYAAGDSRYNAGNYFDVDEDALDGGEINPGDTVAASGGGTIVFNPGELVRPSGEGSDVVSTIETIGVNGATSYYEADGSGRSRVGYEGDLQEEDITLTVFNFGGKTELDFGLLEYDVYYSKSESEWESFEQEWRRDGFHFGYTRSGAFYSDPWFIDYDDELGNDRFDPAAAVGPTAFYEDEFEWKQSYTEEEVTGAKIDLTYELPDVLGFSSELKTGINLRRMERSFDYDEREYDFDEDAFPFLDYVLENPYDPVFPDRARDDAQHVVPFTVDVESIFNDFIRDENSIPGFIDPEGPIATLTSDNSARNDYWAEENTYAGYLMGEFKRGDFTVIAGVRYEKVEFETTGFDRLTFDSDLASTFTLEEAVNREADVYTKYTAENDYDQLLPSVHFRYDFLDGKLVTRASYGRTYSKPEIKDMVGDVNGDISDDDDRLYTYDVPNPLLPALESDNFDLSVEFYTDSGGYFQAALFYKSMKNYAFNVTQNYSRSDYEQNFAPLYGAIPAEFTEVTNVDITTPTADTDAVNKGIELVAQQQLSFLPGPLDGFSVNANATFADSEADFQFGSTGPVQGHSDYMYNLSVQYNKYNFFARAKWSYRHHFFENISVADLGGEIAEVPGEYQYLGDDVFMNPGWLDLEFAYTFELESAKFRVFTNVTNVLEQINASRQGVWNYLDDVYPKKRRWTIGVEATF